VQLFWDSCASYTKYIATVICPFPFNAPGQVDSLRHTFQLVRKLFSEWNKPVVLSQYQRVTYTEKQTDRQTAYSSIGLAITRLCWRAKNNARNNNINAITVFYINVGTSSFRFCFLHLLRPSIIIHILYRLRSEFFTLKPNSITSIWSQTGSKLVADL